MFSKIFIRTRVNLCTAVQKRVFCWWSESRIQRLTCDIQGQTNHLISFRARQKCINWHQHLSNKQSKASLWLRETCLIVALLPLMIMFITACPRKCTIAHHGETALRSERRKPPLSNVGGSNFMRILGCCSDCEQDAWDLSVLMGDGDECKHQLPNPSIQEHTPDWNKDSTSDDAPHFLLVPTESSS